LNFQPDSRIFISGDVAVPGVNASGDTVPLHPPVDVSINLSGLDAGTRLTLFFKLTSSGQQSLASVDDVQLISGPNLDFDLDQVSDSGIRGDQVTNLSKVNFVGTTNPGQVVSLDIDGNGFNDGTVTADAQGHFTFANITLKAGDNLVRTQATDQIGTT